MRYLPTGDAFENIFRKFERTAFHLEVEDAYETPEESEPFRKFIDGVDDDFNWHKPWLNLVREATDLGKEFTRVRIVTEPHGDYTRWGLAVAPLNISAGEDIRWLARHLAIPLDLPPDDFWLMDDSRVVFTVFEECGRFAGGAETTDPRIVARCGEVRDRVWARAVPHSEYSRRP